MATDVVVFARAYGISITLSLCEGRVSEYRGHAGTGTIKGMAAVASNPKTVYRLARALKASNS